MGLRYLIFLKISGAAAQCNRPGPDAMLKIPYFTSVIFATLVTFSVSSLTKKIPDPTETPEALLTGGYPGCAAWLRMVPALFVRIILETR